MHPQNCRPTLGIHEMNDGLVFEDVHFFNAWNGVHSKPLQSRLQPFVVCGCGLVNGLLLSAEARTKSNANERLFSPGRSAKSLLFSSQKTSANGSAA